MQCPVCLTLPEGEVHQCHEGHCYCEDCWNRLDPRRCPECRQPVPQANRNRAAERAIAALEASCEHCGEATTRGAMAAHLFACLQLPTACAAAAAGCGWAGVLAEQSGHEAACPFVICLRVVAPLQAQNQRLQVQCDGLQARVAPLQAECQELKAQNQQLQSESQELRACVAPLQAVCQELRAQNQELQNRVVALEGERDSDTDVSEEEEEEEEMEVEEGERRQRQRVGGAPHEMELAEAVAALRAHMAVARAAERACVRLAVLCMPEGSEQAAVEAGAIEAVVEAMRAHPQVAGVQEYGCSALACVTFGDDAAGGARSQRAANAEAIEAVVEALRWPWVNVKRQGCCALSNFCGGGDAAAPARRQKAAAAGALEEVVAAMRAHPQMTIVQADGCRALVSICRGGSGVRARRQRATQAGGRPVAVAAMQAHPGNDEVQRHGQEVLNYLSAEV